LGLVGCSLVTHAYDYQIGEPPLACGACPGHADFARTPCIGDGGSGDDGATSTTYYFAVDSVSLGADAGYAVGLSQDCADRDGSAACTPTTPWLFPFPSLPHGIENAFGTNVLGPMQASFPGARDLETDVNAWIQAGLGGFVVSIDGWNGLADDANVEVRIATVVPSGATPIVDKTNPPSISAAVSGGKLVATFEASRQVSLRFGTAAGAFLTLRAFGVVVVGTIDLTKKTIDPLVVAGYLGSSGQRGATFEHDLGGLLLGCPDGGTQAATDRAGALANAAYDLPTPPSMACDRMSFGFSAHATLLATTPLSGSESRSSCPIPDDSGGPTPDSGLSDSSDASTDADATTD
jgi:hypothetical protein